MTRRMTGAVAALCAAAGLIGLGAATVGAHARATGKPDKGTVYISVNRSAGGLLYASGTNMDKLLGAGAITAQYKLTTGKNGDTLTSNHTVLYTPTGSLTGTSSAHITLAGTTETFSDGKINLTTGKGSQKGHSLVGTFSGSGSTTANQNTLTYKGTYK